VPISTKVAKNDPSFIFKSVAKRKTQLTSDPSFPSPGSYNPHGSFGTQPLQGGSPNNILVLQKAEQKKIVDKMFPFLVPTRMPESKHTLENANVGPGSYLDSVNLSKPKPAPGSQVLIDSSTNQLLTLNPSKKHGFGAADERFGSQEREIGSKSDMPGPGAYIS